MSLEKIINDAWEKKDQISPNSEQGLKDTINQVEDLNKSLVGCNPCKKAAKEIERKMAEQKINELKIDGIKRIVDSIFQATKNDQQKN